MLFLHPIMCTCNNLMAWTWQHVQGNHRWHAAMADQHGGIFPYRIMHLHMVQVSDPALCSEILCMPEMDKEPHMYKTIATVRAHSPLSSLQAVHANLHKTWGSLLLSKTKAGASLGCTASLSGSWRVVARQTTHAFGFICR